MSAPCHRPSRATLAALAALACTGAHAQGVSGLRVTPTLSIEGSYIETRGRLADNGREAVLRASPGVRVVAAGGPLSGALDYTGSLIERQGRAASEGSEWQNALSASFLAEAVPNWAFVEASARVSQQSVSAFGQQSVSGSLQSDSNRSEVSTVTLSPYIRGSLAGWANYEVRLQGSVTENRDPLAADSRTQGGSVTLSSPSRATAFGWALSANQERSEIDTSADRPLDNHRVNASVWVTPGPDLRLTLSGGRESVDDGAVDQRVIKNTTSLGLSWNPSPRTALQAELGERYFGRSNRLSFSHRSARTVWSYAFVRDLETGADGLAFGRPRSLYDLYFDLWSSIVPDPQQRRDFVLQQLSLAGLDPNQILQPSAQVASFSVTRRQDLSMAWSGLRTTFSVQGFTSAQSRIVSIAGGEPTLAEPIRQHGYSSSLAYRLTPQVSVNFGGQRLMTFSTSAQSGTDLKSATAGLSSQLGRRTTASLSARYSVFNSATEPYRDTAVSASLGLRF